MAKPDPGQARVDITEAHLIARWRARDYASKESTADVAAGAGALARQGWRVFHLATG